MVIFNVNLIIINVIAKFNVKIKDFSKGETIRLFSVLKSALVKILISRWRSKRHVVILFSLLFSYTIRRQIKQDIGKFAWLRPGIAVI